ncbi:hypothetical protein NL676_028178 [Syzygium grande]|nr:hypothetical protein NL676_028178 [Syzygium grande]
MVPKKVEFMPELPKTSTGKIQKSQLRALAKTIVVSDDAPTTSLVEAGKAGIVHTPQDVAAVRAVASRVHQIVQHAYVVLVKMALLPLSGRQNRALEVQRCDLSSTRVTKVW